MEHDRELLRLPAHAVGVVEEMCSWPSTVTTGNHRESATPMAACATRTSDIAARTAGASPRPVHRILDAGRHFAVGRERIGERGRRTADRLDIAPTRLRMATRRADIGLGVGEPCLRLIDVGLRTAAATGAGLHPAQDFLVHAHVLHRDVEDALCALDLEIGLDRAERDGLGRVIVRWAEDFDAEELAFASESVPKPSNKSCGDSRPLRTVHGRPSRFPPLVRPGRPREALLLTHSWPTRRARRAAAASRRASRAVPVRSRAARAQLADFGWL